MIVTLGRRVAAGSVALAAGALGVVATQSPAFAAGFSAKYSCTSPLLGTQAVTIDGTLTASPNPATAGSPVAFALHIAKTSLTAPVTINSWSITGNLTSTGAQTATIPIAGSGGSVPANQPITGDLSGSWTPTVAGTDQISGGNVTITVKLVLLGTQTITCTPDGVQTVGETLTVT